MIPVTQAIDSPARTDARITGTHTEDMTGWTLEAVLKDADGAVVATATSGDGITVSGPRLTIDYTDGTSYDLDPGRYRLYVRRTDDGYEDLLAVVRWTIKDCDPA